MAKLQIDDDSRKELDRISELDIPEMTDEDKAFIFSRRDYLGDHGKRKFKGVIEEMRKAAEAKLEREAGTVKEERSAAPKGKKVVKENPDNAPAKDPHKEDEDEDEEEDETQVG